jgi:hypothetical protein
MPRGAVASTIFLRALAVAPLSIGFSPLGAHGVLTVVDRHNVREGTPGINPGTFQATHLFNQLFPRTPSAGILGEF